MKIKNNYHPQLGQLTGSVCPECGNIDYLTAKETNKKVHCQRCYLHYDFEGESSDQNKDSNRVSKGNN